LRLRAGGAERVTLREGSIDRADRQQHTDSREGDCRKEKCVSPKGDARHGHLTKILLANCAP
jgi:hypothetical protein